MPLTAVGCQRQQPDPAEAEQGQRIQIPVALPQTPMQAGRGRAARMARHRAAEHSAGPDGLSGGSAEVTGS